MYPYEKCLETYLMIPVTRTISNIVSYWVENRSVFSGDHLTTIFLRFLIVFVRRVSILSNLCHDSLLLKNRFMFLHPNKEWVHTPISRGTISWTIWQGTDILKSLNFFFQFLSEICWNSDIPSSWMRIIMDNLNQILNLHQSPSYFCTCQCKDNDFFIRAWRDQTRCPVVVSVDLVTASLF